MTHFAVIDTETNWVDQVMSIGTVIADSRTFKPVAAKYHVLPAFCEVGGMYEDALFIDTPVKPICCTRQAAMKDIVSWCNQYGVRDIFAYNARFDKTHLPELGCLQWHDIMRLAAYKQYNSKIPSTADLCSTGRLKRGYGVESVLRMLSGDYGYHETHNAIFDALDELEIMHLLGHPLEHYFPI